MNKIKILLLATICSAGLISCDKETIKINAKIANCEYKTCKITVDPIGEGFPELIANCEIENGEFDIKTKDVKPPVKLSFNFKDTVCKVWIGEYGKSTVEGDFKKEIKLNINNTFFNRELNRFIKVNDDSYLSKVMKNAKELKELHTLEDQEKLTDVQKERMYFLENQEKKAYKLRKKALLSAVRTDPRNVIAMTVFFDMFPTLTSWQKKECQKNASKYFSDSGLNWQLKH